MSPLVVLSLLMCAAPVKVMPGDESGKDKSFAAFKSELEAAVKRKDATFLRAALDDKAQAGFGATDDVKEFLEVLPLVPSSLIWNTLTVVLGQGCARTSTKEFVCPHLFAKAPEDFDWFEHLVLVKNVAIRSEASVTAKVLTTRSYEVVKGVRTDAAWVKVQTLDGIVGHAQLADLQSPLDTRAFFKKSKAGWKLTFLGAGD